MSQARRVIGFTLLAITFGCAAALDDHIALALVPFVAALIVLPRSV